LSSARACTIEPRIKSPASTPPGAFEYVFKVGVTEATSITRGHTESDDSGTSTLVAAMVRPGHSSPLPNSLEQRTTYDSVYTPSSSQSERRSSVKSQSCVQIWPLSLAPSQPADTSLAPSVHVCVPDLRDTVTCSSTYGHATEVTTRTVARSLTVSYTCEVTTTRLRSCVTRPGNEGNTCTSPVCACAALGYRTCTRAAVTSVRVVAWP